MTSTAADDGWMQTLTGKKFYPLNPTLDSIDIIDIAGALSKMCRFGGHCNKFYSISEHCWHLSYKASPPNRLAALMHDASEAYLVDTSPSGNERLHPQEVDILADIVELLV